MYMNNVQTISKHAKLFCDGRFLGTATDLNMKVDWGHAEARTMAWMHNLSEVSASFEVAFEATASWTNALKRMKFELASEEPRAIGGYRCGKLAYMAALREQRIAAHAQKLWIESQPPLGDSDTAQLLKTYLDMQ